MSRLRRLVAAGLIATAAFGGFLPTVRSLCIGPTVALRPRSVVPGEQVQVVGKYWSSICDDVGSCSVGCFGGETCDQPGDVRPILNLRIELEPRADGPTLTIAEDVDADAETRFRVETTIPNRLAPGVYEVVARNDAGHEAVGPTIRVVDPD